MKARVSVLPSVLVSARLALLTQLSSLQSAVEHCQSRGSTTSLCGSVWLSISSGRTASVCPC